MEQAESDLRWAKLLAGTGGYDVACFLSQQVAEKAIKAFLYAQGEELVFSHAVKGCAMLPRAMIRLSRNSPTGGPSWTFTTFLPVIPTAYQTASQLWCSLRIRRWERSALLARLWPLLENA